MTWLLYLYPPRWRRRYGKEFVALIAPQRVSFFTVLDIIGDLALLGMPILGKVVAERSGHIMHAGLMSKLLRVRSAWDIVDMR